jgi:uncharacterized RDD family membrane protein YckC
MDELNNRLTLRNKASFWRRFIAFNIDYFLIFCFSFLISSILEFPELIKYWIFIFLFHVYFIILEKLTSQTLGKMIMKIRVVNEKGENLSFSTSLIRNISKIISALPLMYGFIQILAPHVSQTIHDRIAKCYVMKI